MIDALKALFTAAPRSVVPHSQDIHVAAAVLLIDAACMDGEFNDAERETVTTILQRHFGLTSEAATNLVTMAEAKQDKASDLNRYTLTVKSEFSEAQRVELVELLWEVVYVDGELHAYEANLLRRIAGLLYVSDRERGEARKRVLSRLGVSE